MIISMSGQMDMRTVSKLLTARLLLLLLLMKVGSRRLQQFLHNNLHLPEPQAQAVPEAPAPSQAAPPVPAEGLPAGWSMEQWNAYGQMWLEQNGRA